jgi:hypothetical protein
MEFDYVQSKWVKDLFWKTERLSLLDEGDYIADTFVALERFRAAEAEAAA